MGNEKIFGIGLSKTGTTSLMWALYKLKIKATHFPQLQDFFNYKAVTDVTCIYLLDQLLQLFPDCKLIYTTRNTENWIKSCLKFFDSSNSLTVHQHLIRLSVYGSLNPTVDDLIRTKEAHEKKIFSLDKEILILDLDNTKENKMLKLKDFLQIDTELTDWEYPHKNETK